MEQQIDSELSDFLEKLTTPEAARVILEIVREALKKPDAEFRSVSGDTEAGRQPGFRMLRGPDGEVIQQPYCRSKGWVQDRNRERYVGFLSLLKQNKRPSEIARETGAPIGTIYFWIRRMEIGRTGEDIGEGSSQERI